MPGCGQEAPARVLAVDAELDRVPAGGRILGEAQLVALGDAELLADQVDAAGLLGDRMLDLQAGVDLEEADHPVVADQELDRARPGVVGLAADGLGAVVDAGPLLVGEERGRSLLDQLLVAPLQRAVAGADDDDVAVLVGQHLGLDVPGAVEVSLDEALAPPERGHGLADRAVEQIGDLLDRAGDLEPAPAAAERGLDRDRQSVLLRERDDLVRAADRVLGAGDERGAGLEGNVAGGDLVAEVADGLRRRPDPGQPGVEDGLGEVGVLGQEPVAGVHGVGAGPGRGLDDLLDDQVRVGRGAAAEGERLVGHPGVRRVAVGIGVNSDRRIARVPAGPDDADRDLTPVGDEHLLHWDGLLTRAAAQVCRLPMGPARPRRLWRRRHCGGAVKQAGHRSRPRPSPGSR